MVTTSIKGRTRSTRRNAWRGIPATERPKIARAIKVLRAGGANISPAELYVRIEQEAATTAARERESETKRKRERRENARKAIRPAIEMLVTVEGILTQLSKQELDEIDGSITARAVLREAGRELERALYDLGVYDGSEYGEVVEGLFVEYLRGAKPTAEARHV